MTFRVPVDFSDVEEFEVIPAAVYAAVVESVEFVEAKDEEHYPQLKIVYTITEDGEYLGKKVSQWLSFSPKSTFWMKSFFDAFGITDSLSELVVDEDTQVVTKPNLEGSVVAIKVLVQPHYQDRTRKVNKIDTAPVVKSVAGKSVADEGGKVKKDAVKPQPGRRIVE